jgi:hypothetical protein
MRIKILSTGRHVPVARRITVGVTVGSLLFLTACSTQAPEVSPYYRTAQTQLTVNSIPSGMVNLDNRYVGVTPVTFPIDYEQEVQQQTKNVTYWETHPGLSLFLTIASLGVYLPFSMIPVDTETSHVPLENYQKNRFLITVDSAGFEQWKQELVARGEKTLQLNAQLEKKTEH